jgi:hypothetical protein
MSNNRILFATDRLPLTPSYIAEEITNFKYTVATSRIIQRSRKLDSDGKVFMKCASLILSNFGMTRSGHLKDHRERQQILWSCWNEVGGRLLKIHDSVISSGYSRERFLVELNEQKLENLIAEIWLITKKILPFLMGDTSYGLVGASKILFSVLPEMVLPIDNIQWLKVFKTVDLGDVLKGMVVEIKLWEDATGEKLNKMDDSCKLTTLPAVYNVMAMAARPGKKHKRNLEES